MVPSPHLSEAYELETDLDEELAPFWPLNVALIVLGSAILAIAFRFLDAHDPRIIYNPWTYAVATPVLLLVLSAALSQLVSRVIEKSMQLAFLLSVLAHLVLLVSAMNIVVFSRIWPDLLDSFAQQREQLKRELQANQYHRIAEVTQTGSRPDYLRYVPTQHQPTELEQAESAALQLARDERANLVSPAPEIERTANPHIAELERAYPAVQSTQSQAASLSRSRLESGLRNDRPEVSEPYPVDPLPLQLSPTELAESRAESKSATPKPPTLPNPSPQRPTRETPLARAPTTAAAPRQRAEASRLPRSIPPPQVARADTDTSLPADAEAGARPNPVASANARLNRRQYDGQPQLQPLSGASPQASQFGAESSLPERQPGPVAEIALGDTRMIPRHPTAGGLPGPPAPTSLPVAGIERLASQFPSPTELSPPETSVTRQRQNSKSIGALPKFGIGQAPQWRAPLSIAGGSLGVAPTQAERSDSPGTATLEDVASLSGAGVDLERSRMAVVTPLPGTVANVPDSQETGNGGESLAADSSPSPAELQRATSSRPQSSTASAPPGSPAWFTDQDVDTNLQPRGERTVPTEEELSLVAGSQISRSPPASGGPTAPQIDMPETPVSPAEPAGTPQLDQPFTDVQRARRSTRSPSRQPRLEIDAPVGSGGLNPLLARVGPLLARPGPEATEPEPFDLDVGRFKHPRAGGPLAAGHRAHVPKPAFQQRLERLQDRVPADETTVEPQTELAIERGLEFLARTQRDDGSWRLQDFDTEVLVRSDTAATGMSLLAFQGAGYTHKQFKYADTVGRGLQFLIRNQKTDGDLYIPQDPASDQNAWLYSHAIAALALTEAYGMTQDAALRSAAQNCIDFVVTSQDPGRGGWRYRPGLGSDTSVSGWYMMALKSAQLAGLDVPTSSFRRLNAYLESSQVPNSPHLYRYNPFAADTPQQRHGLQPTPVMTSVGLLMRLYLGWHRQQPEMIDGTDYLLQYPPRHGTSSRSFRDTYYWYYATQVLFHMGGRQWEQWHDQLYPLLIEHQVTQGEFAGSWDPISPTPDLWARYGGRLYVTAMNLLSLEVSYRHLPLYDAHASSVTVSDLTPR